MEFMSLRFLDKAENIIFCGSPGVGKTNLAVSIGIEAAKQRKCVYFVTFADLINQLKKAEDENRLEQRLNHYCRYKLLTLINILKNLLFSKPSPTNAGRISPRDIRAAWISLQ